MTQGNKDATSTMGEFAKVAKRITNYLQFTWDSPHLHEDWKMTVLDTNMWDYEERDTGVAQEVLGDMDN